MLFLGEDEEVARERDSKHVVVPQVAGKKRVSLSEKYKASV